ncbi:fimbrial protein [Serratia fonticola]|uniref:fimbrial protein n=1 Tax=Serratia fonticola TaxID=47917 RepID=UPI0013781C4D|nr:type 1 fimbrial protein [Serratia fonticola]NCG54962.1 hypothetical protein [Serratia fonticola]
MRLNTSYLKAVLGGSLSLWAGFFSVSVHAVTLNFSAQIVQGTCSLSLDKSVLPLGTVSQSLMHSEMLVNLHPFTLTADNCNGVAGGVQQPGIVVSGPGSTQGGKWLFRTSDSDVGGAGVMVVQSTTPPNYTDTEVKPSDFFPLAGVGAVPVNTTLSFFAGVSCGGSAGCATVTPGTLTANIMFVFAYR